MQDLQEKKIWLVAERIEEVIAERGETIEAFYFHSHPYVHYNENTYYLPGTKRGDFKERREVHFRLDQIDTELTWPEARLCLLWDEGFASIPSFKFWTDKAVYSFRWTRDYLCNCGRGMVGMNREPIHPTAENPLIERLGHHPPDSRDDRFKR